MSKIALSVDDSASMRQMVKPAWVALRFTPMVFPAVEQAGATAWITKPFKQEQLVAVVAKVRG